MTSEGQDHLSKAEISKDAMQAGAQAAASAVGEVATIITGAVKDVAGAIGGLATELFEIRDASQRAMADHGDVPDDAGVPETDGPDADLADDDEV